MMKEIEKTIHLEGGYVNNGNDPGGETKYGISKKAYPDIDIGTLTPDVAEAIYHRDYWDPLHLDQFQYVPFRFKLFDIAVNQGLGTAQTFLTKLTRPKDTLEAVHELVEMQMKRYVGIVIAKPNLLAFLRGWANRAFETGEDLL